MKNYESSGDKLTLTAPSGGVTSGTVYKIGQLVVVAEHDADEGDTFTAVRKGVLSDQPKATGTAWSEGTRLYWDDGNSRFAATSATGLVECGVAAADAASGDATGDVLLGVLARADEA